MMTTQLIPVFTGEIAGQTVQLCDARDLHKFIESQQEFANWIKNRIDDYGFVENQDFLIILSKSQGGRPRTDYHLTLDMAKELSMVERNEKGRQARRYFIGCEQRLIAKLQEKHPLALQGPPISNKQYQELRRQVGAIAVRFHHRGPASIAVWARLREQLNAPFISRKLPAVQFEAALVLLSALYDQASTFVNVVRRQEDEFFKKVLKMGEDFDPKKLEAQLKEAIDKAEGQTTAGALIGFC
jgi:phage anti-repressor protein